MIRYLGEQSLGQDARALRVALQQSGFGIPQRIGYQYVPLATKWTAGNFDGDAFSTVGSSTLIDVSAEFSSAPANTKHIRAYAVRLGLRDSDTWGNGAYYFQVGPSSTEWYHLAAYCYGGDLLAVQNGIVAASAAGDLYYRCTASGTGTLDVWLEIMGYFM